LTPYRIATPEPIGTKFSTIDYVHERTPLNQIWYKSIHWELLGKWVKYNVFVPFLFIHAFLKLAYIPVNGFSRAYIPVNGFSRAYIPVNGFSRAIAQKT